MAEGQEANEEARSGESVRDGIKANAREGYSAAVRLTLRRGERVFPLAQVGPDWVGFREPVSLVAGPAILEIEIDGRCECTQIELEEAPGPVRRLHYLLA
jgi:hypothetical protein